MPKTKRPARRASTPRGWRSTFLSLLAETSNVSKSAKQAKVDASTVYRLRRDDAEFARQWREALAQGFDTLEMDLLRRARDGRLEGGPKKEQRTRVWDNAVALRLLAAHRETVGKERALQADQDEAAVYAALDRKIETIRRRLVRAQEMREQDGHQ